MRLWSLTGTKRLLRWFQLMNTCSAGNHLSCLNVCVCLHARVKVRESARVHVHPRASIYVRFRARVNMHEHELLSIAFMLMAKEHGY